MARTRAALGHQVLRPLRVPESISQQARRRVILLAIRAMTVPGSPQAPTVHTDIKGRIKEDVRLIVAQGVAVEESCGASPKVVSRLEDVGAEKWIVVRPHCIC